MSFRIVRNDITKMKTDAIVNSANPNPAVGLGTDFNIYKAAGYDELLAARKELGKIQIGQAVFTDGFKLSAKYIIHTVGPNWNELGNDREVLLRSCYRNSLELALELGCRSVAFPLISSGTYGCPKDKALSVALSEINDFLLKTDFSEESIDSSEMEVFLVVYDDEAFDLSSKLYTDIQSFIDSNYIKSNKRKNIDNFSRQIIGFGDQIEGQILYQSARGDADKKIKPERINSTKREMSVLSIEDILSTQTISFQDYLMQLIAERNLSNKEVYKRSNIKSKHFSKIICIKNYVPNKKTVMALAIGLKLEIQAAEKFLSVAGYAFSQSDKIDLIVKFHIINHLYDIDELEQNLFTFTGKTLANYDSKD